MLFIMNNIVIPTYFVSGAGDIMHGVSVYSGTSGAMVQWWFGHNAIGASVSSSCKTIPPYFS